MKTKHIHIIIANVLFGEICVNLSSSQVKNRWADENSSMDYPFSTKFILLLKSLTEIYFLKQ